MLPARFADDPAFRERFEREARAIASLDHPHICALHDVGHEDGVDFLVMPHLDGETLADRLAKGALPLPEALTIAIQVADALDTTHRAGLTHRDLKPGNVFLCSRGPTPGRDADEAVSAKLLDFGLAKLHVGGSSRPIVGLSALSTEQGLTGRGTILGTLQYMAPEQLEGKDADARTDLFAFGAVLYEMVTGQKAFAGATQASVIGAILHSEPPPISARQPLSPPALDRVVQRCLAKDAQARWQTASDLLAELKRVADEASSRTPISRVSQALSRIRRRPLIGATAAVALLVAGLVFFASRRAPALTERDSIVLADFVNTTGDPVFDGALKQGLAVALEQSPFLNILSDERVHETLRYMGRKPDEPLTRAVAREICEREGLKALLAGSIASLGQRYVIALDAVNGRTGDVVARAQIEAEGKEQVLRALGNAASTMRGKLGESLASIKQLDAPLEQATTSSLEALKAYSAGFDLALRGKDFEALALFKRALEVDSNFAGAYVSLSLSYRRTGQGALAVDAIAKAYTLSDRVNERERLRILGFYHEFVTGDLDKAIEASELSIRLYPREPVAHASLALRYNFLGQSEKVIDEEHTAISLGWKAWQPYGNLAIALMRLNRFDEAKQALRQALAQQLDSPFLHHSLYQIAFLEGQAPAMIQQVAWAAGRPEEYQALWWQARAAAFSGHLRSAHEFARRGMELAERRGLREAAAELAGGGATWDAMVGVCDSARKRASTALVLSPEITGVAAVTGFLNVADASARALALCGGRDQVDTVLNAFASRYPKATLVQGVWIPVITAALDIHGGQSAHAIETLKGAAPYERAAGFWLASLRGRAYLQLRMGPEADAEFQNILDHRGDDPLSLLYPLAHLGLARAAALTGDTAKSKKHYQEFLTLWKDADPDLPVLKQAKQEFARLK